MRYYSEDTVKGLLEQLDSHFVKYLENLPSIEIEEPHGRCIDADEFKASIHMNHLNKFATNKDVQVLYKLLNDAPTVLEAKEGFKCDDYDELGIEDEYNCSTCYQPGDVCLLNRHKIVFLGYDKNNPTEKAPSPVGDFDPRF